MSNFAYPSIKAKMLTGQFNWLTNNISVVLVAQGAYTPSTAHQTLLDVPVASRVAASAVLTGRTVSANVVDADDYLFSSVSGPVIGAAILVANGTNDATSSLICYLDTEIGLPFTPNTGPLQVSWDNGPNRIFAL
jgi:hypothetical protein